VARVQYVFRPDDFPGKLDAATRQKLDELFQYLFPEGKQGEPHSGYGILAQSPALALGIARCADAVIQETPWTQRSDLREVAIQALNLHFKCDFSFHAHIPIAQRWGISAEQQAAIPYWRTSNLFDEEQRLVIEYTLAVVAGPVPEELFTRVKEQFGERGAIECTVAIGWWSLWAMLLNATQPEFSPERSQPLPKDGRELQQ